MSMEMLRVIEETSSDSTELQKNIAVTDECGSSSNKKLAQLNKVQIVIFL